MLLKPRCLLVDAMFAADDGELDCVDVSMSNTLTSWSPAADTNVRSLEWGMNLTENMFCVWPVDIVVANLNCEVDPSGRYS